MPTARTNAALLHEAISKFTCNVDTLLVKIIRQDEVRRCQKTSVFIQSVFERLCNECAVLLATYGLFHERLVSQACANYLRIVLWRLHEHLLSRFLGTMNKDVQKTIWPLLRESETLLVPLWLLRTRGTAALNEFAPLNGFPAYMDSTLNELEFEAARAGFEKDWTTDEACRLCYESMLQANAAGLKVA